MLKPFPSVFYLYIGHLITLINKLDNQYRHNSQLWYKLHNLTLWIFLLHFYVSSHKILLMPKHRYSYFHSIKKIVVLLYQTYQSYIFHWFFEGFLYMQCWINHICNFKIGNAFLCIMKIKNILDIFNRDRRWLTPNNDNIVKWWQ